MRIDCSLITVSLLSDRSQPLAGVCLSGLDKAAEPLAPGCKNEKIPHGQKCQEGTGDVLGLVRKKEKLNFDAF